MSQTTDLTVWKIHGHELRFDMEDAEELERYEAAFARMAETERNLVRTGKKSAIVRAYCEMYCTLFDDLFGAGAAQKLFEGRRNARECDEVYDSFLGFVKAQNAGTLARREKRVQAWVPNRAARRAQARAKGK